jgi:hypothetical protein
MGINTDLSKIACGQKRIDLCYVQSLSELLNSSELVVALISDETLASPVSE